MRWIRCSRATVTTQRHICTQQLWTSTSKINFWLLLKCPRALASIHREQKSLHSLRLKWRISKQDHELLPGVPEMTSRTYQSSFRHLGPQLLIRYTPGQPKHGMNDNSCLGYKSVQMTPRWHTGLMPTTCHSKSIVFKREDKPDVYFVLRRKKNSMEKGKGDIKILTTWLSFSSEALSRFYWIESNFAMAAVLSRDIVEGTGSV